MISIVICSRNREPLNSVRINIANTIGIEYEIIPIDNSEGEYGICEAYNKGAAQAKYEVLCFMHEDIRFHTINWGKELISILSDQSIGVVGVAGSTYQLGVPASWWFTGEEHLRMQVIHTIKGVDPKLDIVKPSTQTLIDVAVLDGLWICSRKAVWAKNNFDQKTFPAFHFYDVDYCTNISLSYRVCVTYNILIEHFSKGTINQTWLYNCLAYQRKWRKRLPFGTVKVAEHDRRNFEKSALYEFIDLLILNRMPFKIIYVQLMKLATYGFLNRKFYNLSRRIVALSKASPKKLYATV